MQYTVAPPKLQWSKTLLGIFMLASTRHHHLCSVQRELLAGVTGYPFNTMPGNLNPSFQQ